MAGNSEGAKKGAQTKKEKYGSDFAARVGRLGGRHRGRGHFGKLKDEGRLEELRNLSVKGAEKANKLKTKQDSSSSEKEG